MTVERRACGRAAASRARPLEAAIADEAEALELKKGLLDAIRAIEEMESGPGLW